MKLTQKELKAAIRQAVEAVALDMIQTGKVPSKDLRELRIEEAAQAVNRG